MNDTCTTWRNSLSGGALLQKNSSCFNWSNIEALFTCKILIPETHRTILITVTQYFSPHVTTCLAIFCVLTSDLGWLYHICSVPWSLHSSVWALIRDNTNATKACFTSCVKLLEGFFCRLVSWERTTEFRSILMTGKRWRSSVWKDASIQRYNKLVCKLSDPNT